MSTYPVNNLRFFQFFDHPAPINEPVSCEKAIVIDKAGNRWIDLSVGGLGYNHPEIIEAAKHQIQELPLSSRVFFSRPLAQFVKELALVLPTALSVVYPCNSPSEAMEGAIKLAKGYKPKRKCMISFKDGYHGNTWGAMSICGHDVMRGTINYFPHEVKFLSFGNINQLTKEDLVKSSCVILEPISAMSSLFDFDRADYLSLLRKKCTESKTLLIVNESQVGLGNCGAWTWCESVGLDPDILVIGNVLGAGLTPFGAYATRRKINDAVYGFAHPALHGGTTAGNPLMCVIGSSVLKIIEREKLISNAVLLSNSIRTFLHKFEEFEIEIFQVGLVAALRFPNPETCVRILKYCTTNHILFSVLPGNESTIFVNPPLLASLKDIEQGLSILFAAIEQLMNKL